MAFFLYSPSNFLERGGHGGRANPALPWPHGDGGFGVGLALTLSLRTRARREASEEGRPMPDPCVPERGPWGQAAHLVPPRRARGGPASKPLTGSPCRLMSL
jgi:hypothetical protein